MWESEKTFLKQWHLSLGLKVAAGASQREGRERGVRENSSMGNRRNHGQLTVLLGLGRVVLRAEGGKASKQGQHPEKPGKPCRVSCWEQWGFNSTVYQKCDMIQFVL